MILKVPAIDEHQKLASTDAKVAFITRRTKGRLILGYLKCCFNCRGYIASNSRVKCE
jgi:hypothetical protein